MVLDASAALRAVMDATEQLSLIDRIGAAGHVLAPTLLRAEVASALWKYQRAGIVDITEALARHAEAIALVDRFEDDAGLFPEALRLAVLHDQPVYDALYLVTARRHAASLSTFDRRLHEQCERARVEGVFLGR